VRVAFDSRPVSHLEGVGRYSRCLLAALRETTAVDDQLVQTGRPSSLARSRGADVFHSPWMDGAMLHSPCPTVVTIHELAALKRRSEHLRGGLRLRLRHLAVQRAARVIVPTETVARDALAHLRLTPEQLVVIPEAADPIMYPRDAADVAAVRERFGLPERFLVWVGGLRRPDPTKHIVKLACAPRELPLVLVGATRPWAHDLPGVILTGQVSDEQLAAIYSAAHALVLSSRDEGFGLAAVEALACGTPVVACDAPALREVLGERATFVEAGDMPALIAAAQAVSGPAPAPPPWSWADAARATWGVYASAAASVPGSVSPAPHACAPLQGRRSEISKRPGATARRGLSSAGS
jgi:glycosyltransferase involved in cell wall biosynthesis